MHHINDLKVKETRVILCYHFGSEKLKPRPNKVELLEAVTEFSRKDWEYLVQRKRGGRFEGLVKRDVGGMTVVINKSGHEAGEYAR